MEMKMKMKIFFRGGEYVRRCVFSYSNKLVLGREASRCTNKQRLKRLRSKRQRTYMKQRKAIHESGEKKSTEGEKKEEETEEKKRRKKPIACTPSADQHIYLELHRPSGENKKKERKKKKNPSVPTITANLHKSQNAQRNKTQTNPETEMSTSRPRGQRRGRSRARGERRPRSDGDG